MVAGARRTKKQSPAHSYSEYSPSSVAEEDVDSQAGKLEPAQTSSCESDTDEEGTAVAAKRSSISLATLRIERAKRDLPESVKIEKDTHVHSLRRGVPERPVRGSDPPAGPVRKDDLPHGAYYNVNNWLASHIMAGHNANVERFLKLLKCQPRM